MLSRWSVALEAYAKQVNDIDMECWVTEIKLRARRRLGEISRELEKKRFNINADNPWITSPFLHPGQARAS